MVQIPNKRDDFSPKTKELLACRVGYRCSNPDCRKATIGPNTDCEKNVNIGVAAHISAAAVGGKRYNSTLTPEQRKNIQNGIWLCQNCAKLIDSDESKFTSELIYRWKTIAEQIALLEIQTNTSLSDNINDIESENKASSLDIYLELCKKYDEIFNNEYERRSIPLDEDVFNRAILLLDVIFSYVECRGTETCSDYCGITFSLIELSNIEVLVFAIIPVYNKFAEKFVCMPILLNKTTVLSEKNSKLNTYYYPDEYLRVYGTKIVIVVIDDKSKHVYTVTGSIYLDCVDTTRHPIIFNYNSVDDSKDAIKLSHFDTESFNSLLRDYNYSYDIERCFIIIDIIKKELLKPMSYYDEVAKTYKAKILLQACYPYVAFEVSGEINEQADIKGYEDIIEDDHMSCQFDLGNSYEYGLYGLSIDYSKALY